MNHDDTDPVRLVDAPTMRGAVEGLLAIPTCCTPGCDAETVPFTDRCAAHLQCAPGGAEA